MGEYVLAILLHQTGNGHDVPQTATVGERCMHQDVTRPASPSGLWFHPERFIPNLACLRKQLYGWSSNSSELWFLDKKEKKPFPAKPVSRTSVHRAGLIKEAEKGPGPTSPFLLQGPEGIVENHKFRSICGILYS